MPTRPERDAVRRYLRDWKAAPVDFPTNAILAAYAQIDTLEAALAELADRRDAEWSMVWRETEGAGYTPEPTDAERDEQDAWGDEPR
jgi:hypothetical protein